MVAAHQMRGPHRRVAQGDIRQAYLFAPFQHQQAWALGFWLTIPLVIHLCGKPGRGVAVDATRTAERQVARIAGVDERHARQLGCALGFCGVVIIHILAGEQARARFQMQGEIRRQHQRSGQVDAWRDHQRASSVHGKRIDEFLQRGGDGGQPASIEGDVF